MHRTNTDLPSVLTHTHMEIHYESGIYQLPGLEIKGSLTSGLISWSIAEQLFCCLNWPLLIEMGGKCLPVCGVADM